MKTWIPLEETLTLCPLAFAEFPPPDLLRRPVRTPGSAPPRMRPEQSEPTL